MTKEYKNYSINQYSKENRKNLRKKLNNIKERLQNQNEKYRELFLKPNEQLIEAIDRFLVNHPSKKHYQIGIIQLKKIMNKRQKHSEEIKKLFNFKA